MSRAEKKEKKQTKNKFMVILLLIVIIVLGVLLAMKIFWSQEGEIKESNGNSLNGEIAKPEPEPPIQIFNGDERPYAVMIDNVGKDSWPHAGLNDAYCVYEIIVEGGLTRIMALFKGQDTEEIGPVRSARPYFLDYVLEHDAIYAHFGYTIMANEDISSLRINNINGLTYEGTTYWRTKRLYAPSNAVTSMEKLRSKASDLNYRDKTDKQVFQYVARDYDLVSEDAAESISIKYSGYHTTSYEYDAENKVYLRFMRGTKHMDYTTNEQYTAKNIIIQFAKDTALGDTREVPDKGYRRLHNIGEGEGYFITNGKCIPITWSKESRADKTKYMDLEGNEIVLNDGNVYVQICPIDAKVVIE